MKTGKILHRFTAKDGREVILRTPKWQDIDDFVELMNSIVDEGADYNRDTKVARDEMADWLGRHLSEIEKGITFMISAEIDGTVVANSSINKLTGYSRHVGKLGVMIRKECRDIGIGTELTKLLISQAKAMDLKMLCLDVWSTNKKAIHVYEKAGFKETGQIPKFYSRKRKFIDQVIMAKEIS